MRTWKEQLDEIAKNLKQSAVNLQSKESAMNNNTDKVVEQVKENVNKMVEAGKEVASNPRIIGKKLADTFNKMNDTKSHAKDVYDNKKDQVKDAFKLGFAIIKEGLKEVQEGYTETRYKKEVKEEEVKKTSI